MVVVLSCSVACDYLCLHGLQPTRLLCPWNFPDKNNGVNCYFLLQGIFPTQGLNLHVLHLLHWQTDSLPLHHLGSSYLTISILQYYKTCMESVIFLIEKKKLESKRKLICLEHLQQSPAWLFSMFSFNPHHSIGWILLTPKYELHVCIWGVWTEKIREVKRRERRRCQSKLEKLYQTPALAYFPSAVFIFSQGLQNKCTKVQVLPPTLNSPKTKTVICHNIPSLSTSSYCSHFTGETMERQL